MLVTPTATRVTRVGTDGLPYDLSTRLQGPVALGLLRSGGRGATATTSALRPSPTSYQDSGLTTDRTVGVLSRQEEVASPHTSPSIASGPSASQLVLDALEESGELPRLPIV